MTYGVILQNQESTWENIFQCPRDYTLSARLWRYIGYTDPGFYNDTNVHNWLQQGIAQKDPSLFISAVWWLCRARNIMVIEKEDFPFPTLEHWTRSLASLVSICNKVVPASPTALGG